ncbi:hypothetical protein PPL_08731 [Heterostelium album PN500]|uniref:Uncharacterized protein n=1 Tax=Heterostelium pallidum (strain ATCC 26659 / Pp 5 / PN500) TaxID=670386 RepID=D3BJK3_HETP5|nr:hypothetical protein PPL_08731 [Heterostelium album PN500]EFA78083.1 hypothetical protein PPL_08731 [Heterostelium album PN500]|eukprot:XP_020430210.1 hypothetical protein PPL_08731 [Heterostelium album PN500]
MKHVCQKNLTRLSEAKIFENSLIALKLFSDDLQLYTILAMNRIPSLSLVQLRYIRSLSSSSLSSIPSFNPYSYYHFSSTSQALLYSTSKSDNRDNKNNTHYNNNNNSVDEVIIDNNNNNDNSNIDNNNNNERITHRITLKKNINSSSSNNNNSDDSSNNNSINELLFQTVKYEFDQDKIDEMNNELSDIDKQLETLMLVDQSNKRFDRILMKRLLRRKNQLLEKLHTPKPPSPSTNKLAAIQMRQDMFMSMLPITLTAPQDKEIDQLFLKFKYSPKLALQQLKSLLVGTYRVMMQPEQVEDFLDRMARSIYKSTEVLNLLLQYYTKNDRLAKIVRVIDCYDSQNEMNTATFEILYEYAENREFLVLNSYQRLDVIQYILERVVTSNSTTNDIVEEEEKDNNNSCKSNNNKDLILLNWNLNDQPLKSPLGQLIVYNEQTAEPIDVDDTAAYNTGGQSNEEDQRETRHRFEACFVAVKHSGGSQSAAGILL